MRTCRVCGGAGGQCDICNGTGEERRVRIIETSVVADFEEQVNRFVNAGYVLTRLTTRAAYFVAIMELPTGLREFFKEGLP